MEGHCSEQTCSGNINLNDSSRYHLEAASGLGVPSSPSGEAARRLNRLYSTSSLVPGRVAGKDATRIAALSCWLTFTPFDMCRVVNYPFLEAATTYSLPLQNDEMETNDADLKGGPAAFLAVALGPLETRTEWRMRISIERVGAWPYGTPDWA